MSTFIETICVRDGMPLHLPWHQARVDLTFRLKLRYAKPFLIDDILKKTTGIPSGGMVRCTIEYSASVTDVRWAVHEPKRITTLKLVELPDHFDYSFKYADRTLIDRLWAWRGYADDILMMRNGWLTDTSVANIALLKNGRWYTPAQPLLAGTTWKRLVSAGILIPRPIYKDEFGSFESWRVFNAMNDWPS